MTSVKWEGRVQYGNAIAEVAPAAGARGVLCHSVDGEGHYYFFRVYGPEGNFTDYDLHHDDLEITISDTKSASFYRIGEDCFLDHSPEVLGLKRLDSEGTSPP